jgi:hypothetical protein
LPFLRVVIKMNNKKYLKCLKFGVTRVLRVNNICKMTTSSTLSTPNSRHSRHLLPDKYKDLKIQ